MNINKTLEEDTYVFFDRTEFNLKGYDYYIKNNCCYICSSNFEKLKGELGNSLFEYAISCSNERDKIFFIEDEFEGTFNPFKEAIKYE